MLVEGDSVLVKGEGVGPMASGVIHSKIGPASFTVDLEDGRRVRRHLDQVRKNTSTNVDELSTTTETNDDFSISVANPKTVEPPTRDVLSGVNENSELRHPECTKCPPQHFASDIN